MSEKRRMIGEVTAGGHLARKKGVPLSVEYVSQVDSTAGKSTAEDNTMESAAVGSAADRSAASDHAPDYPSSLVGTSVVTLDDISTSQIRELLHRAQYIDAHRKTVAHTLRWQGAGHVVL
jgi:aspartate carbamoyltransferase catalytic subunit